MAIRSGVESGAGSPLPTLRGWAVLAAAVLSLIFAVLLRRQDLLIIGLFLAVLVLASLIAVALVRPSFTVTRSLTPDTIAAGDNAHVILTLHPGSSGIIGLRSWRDRVAPGLTTLEQHGVKRNGTDDSGSLRSVLRAERRGRYWIGPVLLEFTDPFGIARGEQLAGSATLLTVTPPVLDVAADGSGMFGGDGSEQVLQRPASPSADELIARQYRSGDPMRRVHWRATARHGELMVRQEEQRGNPAARLVVDTSIPEGRSRGGAADPDFELLVEVVAAIGAFLIRSGFSITVAETARNGESVFERAGGEKAFLSALAVLQPWKPSAEEPALPLADAVRGGGGAVPLVAVLRAGSAAALSMTSLRPHGDPGIIFLVGSKGESATTGVAAYPGWSAFPVVTRSDIGPACRRGLGATDRVDHG